MTQALGFIEVIGFPPAIEAADAALKAANVQLLGVAKVDGGIMTVQLMGDIGAIVAAVDAGAEAAKRIGEVRVQHVIARTEESVLTKIILPSTKKTTTSQVSPQVDKTDGVIPVRRMSEAVESITTPITLIEDISVIEPTVESIEVLPVSLQAMHTEETLNKLSMAKLKELLVEHGINISTKKLKSAKKQDLIQMIMDKQNEEKGGS